MQSMYLLIPLSLILFVVGIWAIYYAIKSHQFDDLDSAAQRIILEDRQARREQLASPTLTDTTSTATAINPTDKS